MEASRCCEELRDEGRGDSCSDAREEKVSVPGAERTWCNGCDLRGGVGDFARRTCAPSLAIALEVEGALVSEAYGLVEGILMLEVDESLLVDSRSS